MHVHVVCNPKIRLHTLLMSLWGSRVGECKMKENTFGGESDKM